MSGHSAEHKIKYVYFIFIDYLEKIVDDSDDIILVRHNQISSVNIENLDWETQRRPRNTYVISMSLQHLGWSYAG